MHNRTARTILSISLTSLLVWTIAPFAQAASPTLTAITLSPGTATVVAGQNQNFALTGTLSDGTSQDVTEQTTWTIPGGGFTGIPGQRGVFTGIAQGTWTLTAAIQGMQATAVVTVVHGPATSLNLMPKSTTLTADGVLPLRVYGVDSQGNGFDIHDLATFSTTDPRGTVNSDGYVPATAGAWTVTATLGSLTASTAVTITPGMLAALTTTPTSLVTNPGDTAQLTAQGTDAKGNPVDTPVTWDATNPNIGTVNQQGQFHAKSSGQTNIIARSGGVVGTTPVVVQPVTPEVSAASTSAGNDIIAVTKPESTPQVAGEEVAKQVPQAVTGQESTATTTTAAVACKNIAHSLAILFLIAFVLLLSGYFAAIRNRQLAWWWVPPVVLTAALVVTYALAFCSSTYLWWPWTGIGIAVVFVSVYYQRLDQPPPNPPSSPPQ